jgi:hypothetical protein
MTLTDYRKLCPNSGHALQAEERGALDAGVRTPGRARAVRCGICGRTVDARPDPGTGTSLLFSMHLRAEGEAHAAGEGSP